MHVFARSIRFIRYFWMESTKPGPAGGPYPQKIFDQGADGTSGTRPTQRGKNKSELPTVRRRATRRPAGRGARRGGHRTGIAERSAVRGRAMQNAKSANRKTDSGSEGQRPLAGTHFPGGSISEGFPMGTQREGRKPPDHSIVCKPVLIPPFACFRWVYKGSALPARAGAAGFNSTICMFPLGL